MATVRNLDGPKILLASANGYDLYLTYIVESQDVAAGTTTIRYGVFDTPWEAQFAQHEIYGPVEVGDVISTPAVTYNLMYKRTNPNTGNTFDYMTSGTYIYPDVVVTEITSQSKEWVPQEQAYYYRGWALGNRWIVSDIYLVVNSLDTYDLNFQILGWNDLTVARTSRISLSDYGIITSAPIAFTDEASPTVQYINPRGEQVISLQLGIANATTNEMIIAYRDIPKVTSGSYTFNFTQDELNAFYSFLATTTSGGVYFAIKTAIGEATNMAASLATLSLVSYSPVLNPSITDTNATTAALTGNNQKFIKYHSTARFVVNATPRKGASIASYKTIHGNATYRGATGTVNNIELNKFELSATDTRNITTTQTVNISMIDYVKVTCNIAADLPTTNDTVPLTVSGNYWNSNFGAQANTLTIQYRYKSNTAPDYTDWITADVTPTYDGHTYEAVFEAQVPNHVDIFTLQARAIDKLMTIESKTVSVQSFPVFDWDANDFNFNVPVSIQDHLYVTGNIYQNGSAMTDFVVGYGTSGIWTWRKWASGIAECWGTIAPAAHNITTAWGSIYTKDNAIARQSYPFTFTEDPVVSMTLHNPTGNCWSFTGTPGGVSLSPAFGLARGTSGSVTVGARISAIGRWK